MILLMHSRQRDAQLFSLGREQRGRCGRWFRSSAALRPDGQTVVNGSNPESFCKGTRMEDLYSSIEILSVKSAGGPYYVVRVRCVAPACDPEKTAVATPATLPDLCLQLRNVFAIHFGEGESLAGHVFESDEITAWATKHPEKFSIKRFVDAKITELGKAAA